MSLAQSCHPACLDEEACPGGIARDCRYRTVWPTVPFARPQVSAVQRGERPKVEALRSQEARAQRSCAERRFRNATEGDVASFFSERRLCLDAAIAGHFVVVVEQVVLPPLDFAIAALQLLEQHSLIGE